MIHFIYNTLASIKWLVLQGDKVKASDTINSFISLLQNTISNTSETITVAQEVQNLTNYVFINETRYGDNIKVNFNVFPQCNNYKIPKLILQPFIENAIWHGLMHREGEKKLWIQFSKQENQLICMIEDNGVGREFSAAIKAQKLGTHYFESKGTRLSEQRIESLNQQLEGKAAIKITDLKNGNGAIGTRVTIELPLQSKTNQLDKDPDH